jgi:hypothetical protein
VQRSMCFGVFGMVLYDVECMCRVSGSATHVPTRPKTSRRVELGTSADAEVATCCRWRLALGAGWRPVNALQHLPDRICVWEASIVLAGFYYAAVADDRLSVKRRTINDANE